MIKKTVLWIAVILWMAVIFTFSSQPAVQSDELSKGIVYKVIEFLSEYGDIPVFSQPDNELFAMADILDHYIRKLAHFSVFAVLGILVYNLMAAYGIKRSKIIFLAALVCFLYAVSDEVHQLFVDGRAGQIKDVVIDSGGSVLALTVTYLLFGRRADKRGE